MAKITFNNRQSPFFDALREKIDNYFAEKKVDQTGNSKLYLKTAILAGSAVTLYVLLVFVDLPNWLALSLCGLLGVGFASIGFNIMHDGAHGSYSNNKQVNNLAAYSLNLMGGSSFMWKIKHNIIHHTFTNIEGVDDDIDVRPLLRLNDQQPKYWFHRFQHYYAMVLYGATYFIWVFWKDYEKYFSRRVGVTPIRKMKTTEHVGFWFSKILYIALFLGIPAYTKGIADTLIGYSVLLFFCGLVIAVVFQLAHTVEGTHFPQPNPDSQKIEEEWAVHQIQTTANFATQSKIASWFMGGLNFQVEHHLFPRISHIHYPELSRIVRETCKEFNLDYIEYPTVWSAIGAHLRHLKTLGKPGLA
ncbi:acyl-CoA desaturase [soil metagenome]